MSKPPEDDSQATERGKTRASQMLGETDGSQVQVEEEKTRDGKSASRLKKRKQEKKCNAIPQIINASWEQ